jgi:hypothetical protein
MSEVVIEEKSLTYRLRLETNCSIENIVFNRGTATHLMNVRSAIIEAGFDVMNYDVKHLPDSFQSMASVSATKI